MADAPETEAVKRCRQLLAQSCGWHAAVDGANLLCTRYYLGHQWTRVSEVGKGPGFLPQLMSAENLTTVVNKIRHFVCQWHSRLIVRDWEGRIQVREEDESPQSHLTARALQTWYNRFVSYGNLTPWERRLCFGRLICQSSFGAHQFNPQAPCGLDLRIVAPGTLTLDPLNLNPDICQHDEVVESTVISVNEAEALYGRALDRVGVKLDAAVRMSDLIGQESYLGRTLFGLQPGAYDSETRGIVLHAFWRKKHTERVLIVQNPRTWDKSVPRRPDDWIEVENEPWDYGCIYAKLDCFDHPASALSRSLAAELIPLQDTLNLVQRKDLRAVYYGGRFRYMVAEQSLVSPEETLTSNAESAVVRYRQGTAVPSILQQPTMSYGTNEIMARTALWMQEQASVTDPMTGVGVKRGQSGIAYQSLIAQGLGPIQSLKDDDYDAVTPFMNRAARAAVMWYARTSPKKFVQIVGRSVVSVSVLKSAADDLQELQTLCVLKRSAFLAETAAMIDANLKSAMVAGHLPWWDYQWERLFQTGYPAYYGQENELHNVQEIVRRLLTGEMKVNQIEQMDNHQLLMSWLKRLLRRRVLAEYSEDEVKTLQQAILWCEFRQYQLEQREALKQAALGGAPGSELVEAAGSPTAGETPTGAEEMAVAGTPAVGGLVAAPGGQAPEGV